MANWNEWIVDIEAESTESLEGRLAAIVILLLWPRFEREFDQVSMDNLRMLIQDELGKRYEAGKLAAMCRKEVG